MLSIDARGVIPEMRQIASPNYNARPDGVAIELVVIHNISLPPGEFGGGAIEQLFTNTLDFGAHPYFAGLRGLKVSSHFLIRRDGTPVQFVPCAMRAWHAGESAWRGRAGCNDFSIGIELEGADAVPFTERQYRTLENLLQTLRARYPLCAITGHSDVAPGRKTDPGPFFDWPRLSQILP